jgi:hypothetical protein
MMLLDNRMVSTEPSSGATGRLRGDACRPCLPRHTEDRDLLDVSYAPINVPYAPVEVSYARIYDKKMLGGNKNSRQV